MQSNKKRWLAVGLALLVFLLSVFSSNNIKEEKMNLKSQSWDKLLAAEDKVIDGTNPINRIQVISVDRVIMTDENNDLIIDQLENALNDQTVAGVIMHINSPGGSVYASQRVAKKIKEVEEKGKPVYAVMQEMAASGGYYISAGCDKIYASNETWTGSIGVIIQSYSLEGLFDKYGIKEQNITTGKMKDAGSRGRDMSKEEKEYFQGLVDSAFKRFIKIVAEGRNMSESEVKKLADGRVYDGSQALENGLIDEIGDLEVAYKDMAKENNLEDPQVFESENFMPQLSRYLPQFKSFISPGKSDLEVLQEFMKENDNLPMYLYGGYYE